VFNGIARRRAVTLTQIAIAATAGMCDFLCTRLDFPGVTRKSFRVSLIREDENGSFMPGTPEFNRSSGSCHRICGDRA